MKLALLPPIILAIAEQRSLDAVLSAIAATVASQPDIALARVWLKDTDRSCPVCARRPPSSDGEAFHLRASAGHPLDSSVDWSQVDGAFHRIPLDEWQALAERATGSEPIQIDPLDAHNK